MSEPTKPKEESSLKKRIDQDLREALKKQETLKLNVLRMLKSEIRYKEIEKRTDLSNDDIIFVLSSSIKKRKDSIEQFEKGGRQDLSSKERAEIEIITGYLPEQLSDEDVLEMVKQTIEQLKAAGPSDLGMVMKEVMLKLRGRAEGKKVNQMASSQLQLIADS